MIGVEIENNKVTMIPDSQVVMQEVRSTIPGAVWNSLQGQWSIPLTRRSVNGLRKYLTGKQCQLAGHHAGKLAAVADSPQEPDMYIDNDRIIVKFEMFSPYEEIMRDAGGTLRTDGTWSIPLDNAETLIALLDERPNDLMVSSAVKKSAESSDEIPGFTGHVDSLRGIPTTVLKAVREYKEPYKKLKKGKLPVPLDEKFRMLNVNDLYDLITYFPLRYVDRSNPSMISDLNEGDDATIIGTIFSISVMDGRRGTKVIVQDANGNRVSVVFFSMPWIAKQFRKDQEVILTGKYTVWSPPNNPSTRVKQIKDARMDPLHTTGKISVIPIYPQSDKIGVTTYDVMKVTKELFRRLSVIYDHVSPEADVSYDAAVRAMHYPANLEEMKKARQRLVRDELLLLQLHILTVKKNESQTSGIEQGVKASGEMKSFINALPYELTGAQRRTLNEIAVDLASEKPMRRLLQGDVSSGKTTIAHALMLNAFDNGHQGAIIAPTEILAEQLYEGLRRAVEHLPLNIRYLGNKTTAKNKKVILEELASGEIDVIVGTHALLFDTVKFHDLSTVVIDEQHRFGTDQRSKLVKSREDGIVPDMLVMTATPIPRTGAMVLYGDLDLSVLDELPPGRVPIDTQWLQTDAQDATVTYDLAVWDDIREQVAQGHQAYVVASLVEESETIAAASAEESYANLARGPLRGLRLGLMHGKLASKEKEAVMNQFAAGELDVLVATTVIEVGVNVPNATVIAVLDPGRFGIAQLHQIRGRVGRASYQSRCWLVGNSYTPEGVERLSALVRSTDGFYLAEVDLQIRGEGALFGTRQSGVSDLKLASLREDLETLMAVKDEAQEIIDRNDSQYDRLMHVARTIYQDVEIGS